MGDNHFGIGVKFLDGAVLQPFLKRVIHNRTSLVVLNLDRRFWSGPRINIIETFKRGSTPQYRPPPPTAIRIDNS
jgi:hypothetical protein